MVVFTALERLISIKKFTNRKRTKAFGYLGGTQLGMNRSLVIILLLAITLTSCFPESVDYPLPEDLGQAGFFKGLWHGIIMPFAFIISLLNDNVAIYQAGNIGGWYDLGYFIGISMTFSGGVFGSSKARRSRRK